MFMTFAIFLFAFLFYKWYKIYTYWKNRGISHVNFFDCFHILTENVMQSSESGDILKSIYDKYKDERYVGFYNFTQRILLVRDPSLLQKITAQHYDNFSKHSDFLPSYNEPLWTRNILNLPHNEWSQVRKILNPLFSGKNLRAAFTMFETHLSKLVDYLKTENAKGHTVFDVKRLLTRLSNDVVASIAFGVVCDSLNDEDNEFYSTCIEAISLPSLRRLTKIVNFFSPKLAKVLRFNVYSDRVVSFFQKVYEEKLKYKTAHIVTDNDIVNVLLEARKNDSNYAKGEQGKIEITDDLIISQSVIFIFAGLETVSSALSYACYHIATNSDVQNKLYAEIQDASKITFDYINSLQYLDNVISETLRLHPPSLVIDRECVNSFTIDADNENEKPLHIDKGTWIWLMHRAMQYDENYFPNPEKFDPDRFSDDNKRFIKRGAYVPFGMGPKQCMGMRFSLMELKLSLVHLLRNFELIPVKETSRVEEYGLSRVYPIHIGGIWLQINPRI